MHPIRNIFRPLLAVLAVALLAVLAAPAQAQLLAGANWFEREVGDGVVWRYYHFDSLFGAKQSVSYVEVDLNTPGVDLKINYRDSYVGPAPALDSPLYPRQFTSVMAGEIAGAKAAVNGTYFNTQSYNPDSPTTPWGGGTTYLKVDGSVIHTFDGTNVNNFGMGILYNTLSDLTIVRRPAPTGSSQWAGIQSSWTNMMICGPVLLENGVVETYAPTNDHANARHPRTAVGKINADNKLILLTVDGRTDQAAGMSCTELAQVMLALGCDNAINLDGGGSTTLWAAGEPFSGIVNYPSDNSAYDHLGQRRAANALIVVAGAPTPAAWDGRLTNLTFDSLTRSNETYTVTATYTNLGTETWTTSNVAVVPSRAFGRTSAFIPAGQESTFFEMSPSSVATGQTATFTLTFTAPVVATNTLYEENFALWHTTQGYFGPADSELKFRTTVRPELSGAPPLLIVQGTATGPNNQWYVEGPSGWAVSSVSFTADGVSNSGSQRYCSTASLGRFADFKPIFEANGVYRVDVAFPASTNNINNAVYTVNYQGGSQNFTINQNSSSLANTWITLGEFPFTTGASGDFGVHSVRVANPNSSTVGSRFYSGAVRFDYVGPLANVIGWSIY